MNDLYTNGICDAEPSFTNYEEMFSQVQKLNKKIRSLSKKKKGGKKGKKQLKQRLKVLELEHEQLKQFMYYAMYQSPTNSNSIPQQSVWWHGALTNTLPKALELATATINKLPAKSQPSFYLTDGRDRK